MYLDGATNDREAVFQAVGAASACWDNLEGAGVFESEKAKDIGEELMGWVNRPRLGCATTRELIAELEARADVAATVGESWPDYRTVGDG
jgi:hypothetical protein